MTVTELAIKRPTLVVVLFAILGVLGIFGYSQLKYELLPKISPPIINISTSPILPLTVTIYILFYLVVILHNKSDTIGGLLAHITFDIFIIFNCPL